jgi:hypothetical protein
MNKNVKSKKPGLANTQTSSKIWPVGSINEVDYMPIYYANEKSIIDYYAPVRIDDIIIWDEIVCVVLQVSGVILAKNIMSKQRYTIHPIISWPNYSIIAHRADGQEIVNYRLKSSGKRKWKK